jgi:RND family efflux transporter MFP subunit
VVATGISTSASHAVQNQERLGEDLQQSLSLVREWGRLALALFPLGLLCGCGSPNRNTTSSTVPHVPVVKVVRTDISSTLQIASEFEPYQEINVYAKVSGYVQKLNINWGTHVEQGQLMAVLEIPELEEQVHYDEAAMRRSESELTRTEQELSRMQSNYDVAHVTYTRLSGVWKAQPGLISQEELDVAQGKDLEANASVSAAKAALTASEQALAAAKATLEKDRELYAYSRITAPFDGVVTQLNAYTGALLPGGTSSSKGDLSLCHLSQNNLLRLVIPVPERSVPDVHLGDTLAVQVSTLNRTFQGKVARFSDQIDTATRTMHTEIDVPNPRYILVPGMYASVELPLHTVHNALVIPVQAVRSGTEDRGTVMVVNGSNTLERRDITLGLKTPSEIEVTSGLQENEMVVFGEQSQYIPGEHVTPTIVQPPQAE